jgi:phosphoglycerol transferase
MFGQMLCLGLGVQLLTRRRKPNLQIGAACLAIIVVGFLAINLDTFSYRWAHGKNPDVLVRGYYETELFALKPMELFVPPVTHKLTAFAQAGSKYARDAWIKGEMFSPYLGIVGVAGLVWLVAEILMKLLKRRKSRGWARFPAYGPSALWVLCYSLVGGLNCMIALATVPLFRGGNRYSIFISALVLMFMVSRASFWTRRWSREKQFLLAGVILLVGLFDQLPQATTGEETRKIARDIKMDRAFTEAMESKLPPNGMVFQLPVVPYPEPAGIDPGRAYEHFRPYFYSKTLRFSHGSHKGRPRDDWQKDVEKLAGDQMAATLEKYGFAAVYLNRKWFPDRAEGLLKQLAAAGRGQILEDEAREQVCVVLKPSATPELSPPGDRVQLIFGRDWVATVSNPSGQQHWAAKTASFQFFNPPGSAGTSYLLNCQIGSISPGRVSVHLNGKEIWSAELGAGQLAPVNLSLNARSRYNRLEFKSNVLERPSKHNPVPRTFVVIGPKIVRTE